MFLCLEDEDLAVETFIFRRQSPFLEDELIELELESLILRLEIVILGNNLIFFFFFFSRKKIFSLQFPI